MAGDRFPSSIPIPDDARLAAGDRAGLLIDHWDLSQEGLALMEDDPADAEVFVSPVIDEILEAAAPKLYAHWAEGQVGDGAEATIRLALLDPARHVEREVGRLVSDIEIPAEAKRCAGDVLNDRMCGNQIRSTNDAHKTAGLMLSAAYPSLRRQVLESVVEDVARALAAQNGNEKVFDDDWFAGVRVLLLARARRVLGISEGDG